MSLADLDVTQIVVAVVSGGGLATIIAKVLQYFQERQTNQLDREDTAITRWQKIAEERERELAEAEDELRWMRRNYALLWAAYSVGPPPRYGDFPSAYPGRYKE